MPTPTLVLHVPAKPGQSIALPYLPKPPEPAGRRLPNGTLIVTDDTAPSVLYKFTPWENAALAFNEADVYASLRQLENPDGIVQMLGVSGTPNYFVRALERSHIGSLDRFLIETTRSEARPNDGEFIRSILAQIAETMADIHTLGIVHRDLKAENILVFDSSAESRASESLRAKVADFDRAIVLPRGETLSEPVGSLLHMAPELLAWKPYDRKADVYAFGILMFEVAHGGARPHGNVATCMPDSISKADFAHEVIERNLRPNWTHDDEELKRLAATCWAAAPEDRPEFRDILDTLTARKSRGALRQKTISDENSRLKARNIDGVGIASTIGKVRTQMEDAACALSGPGELIVGVFDGLRGPQTSELAARQFALITAHGLEQGSDPKSATTSAIKNIDETLRKIAPPIESGSTAVVAILREDDLLVSWLGDSTAYIFGHDTDAAVALVDRHQPDRHDEAARVASNGGVVGRDQRWLDNGESIAWGPLRVCLSGDSYRSGVALTRALGLFALKPAIGDHPEIIRRKRQAADRFLVLGTDGVFDLLDTKAVHDIITASENAQQAAATIIHEVLKIGAPDNASVIVVDMKKVCPTLSRASSEAVTAD